MTTHACREMAALVTPYVDATLGPAETALADHHFGACARCAALLGAERATRALLRNEAGALREPAPAALRDRVQARGAVVTFAPRAAARRPLWRRLSLAAAASLLVALTGITAAGLLAPSGTLLAAQLTLDHLKCAWLTQGDQGPDAQSAAQEWRAHYGWDITVPPSAASPQLRLVGVRRCLFSHGAMAHLVYDHGGQSVSLFILPKARPSAAEAAIMGHETVTWSRDGRTYAVVADLTCDDMARVGAFLQDHVH
jgi:anti-sigma factor RsiW